ncbi:MAG TPA: hypothetical protein VJM33_16505, partial [Microthrixaceae bacterium]|nr:hypothetical protein [Microthrixaceae bacterium]
MVADAAPELRPAREVIELPESLRRDRRAVARWALEHGRPLHLDSVTIVLAVRDFEARTDDAPFTRWTTQGLIGFLWGSATTWCETRGVELPPALNESLYTYLSYLSDQREFASGSDPLAALREVLVDMGGLNRSGRLRSVRGSRLATTRRL